MNVAVHSLRRYGYALASAILTVFFGTQAVLPRLVSADEITTRSVAVSTSKPSATGVSYTVTFTPVHTLATAEIVVDFCDNSPLIGDTCTATAGTNVPNTAGVTFGSSSDCTGAATVTSAVPDNHTVKATGCTTVSSSTPVSVVFNNITNPSNTGANGGFYARILLYDTSSSYVPGTATSGTVPSDGLGATDDTGGAALSITDNINITAKVFETLTFCVYTGASCAAGSPPALTLGDTTTGALSTTNAYVNAAAKFDMATNAGGGVNVVMRGTGLCRSTVLATCQTAQNGPDVNTISSMTSNTTSLTGSEQFGMCVDPNGSTALTVPVLYNDTDPADCHGLTTGLFSGADTFGFNAASSLGGTNNAGGSQIISSTTAVPVVTGGFAFLGNVAATTEAGIYTTSLNMVATSTY